MHEELLLLALQDDKGKLFFGSMAAHAMAGGLVAELLMGERIKLETDRKKQCVKLIDPTPFGNPILDECIDLVKNGNRRATLQTWVNRFAALKKLHHRVAEQLCEKGVLKEETHRVLWLFDQKVYPERNPKPEKEIIARLRAAIFAGSRDVDPRTVVLVSLANGTGMLSYVFDKKKLKERKKRIDQITSDEVCGKAVSDAVQAAVMAAVIIPMMITTTTR